MSEHVFTLPPGPRLPRLLQLTKWIFGPIPFMEACAERYGDPFTVRLFGVPPMVFVTDPSTIKQIFTGHAHQFRAGQANKVFESLLGPNSLLLLDGNRHRRERKLLMPPFHGARMRLYGEMMWEITDRSIDTWPVGAPFPIHPRLNDITLEVILRVVFGVDDGPRLTRLRALVSDALRIFDWGNPLWGIAVWWRFVHIRSEIRELMCEEVTRRRARPLEEKTDVMSLLVAARDEDGQHMTVKETARLNPVVPVVARQLTSDLRVGNTSLPAGSIAAPCIYLVHRRPDLWEEPEVFDPNRFLGGRADPYQFFPFGGGVRHCIGAAFATYEMKIILARILSRVVLRQSPGGPVRVARRGLILGPSRDLRVIVQRDGAA